MPLAETPTPEVRTETSNKYSQTRNADGTFAEGKAQVTPAPDPKPEVKAEIPTAPKPETRDHLREYLARQAQDLGYSPLDYDHLSTPELERSLMSVVRERLQPKPENKPKPEEDDLPFAAEELAPELAEFIGKLKSARSKDRAELNALKDRMEEVAKREQQRQISSSFERLDDAFDALPADLEKFVGKGSALEMSADQDELVTRRAIIAAAGIDVNKLPSPTKLKAALEKAARRVLRQQEAPKPEVKPEAKPNPYEGRPTKEQWNGGGLSAPTSKSAPEAKTPAEKQARAVKNLAERMNVTGDFGTTDFKP